MWVMPCIVAWSLIPRLASNTGSLDPFGFLFWSSAVSAVCLLVCTVVTGHWPALRAYSTTDLRRLSALAALGAFAYYALLYSEYARCAGGACGWQAATALVTQYTWPAFAMLWSVLLLRDALTWQRTLAFLLGIGAVAAGAAGNPADADSTSTVLLVLAAAMIFGLYSTLLKRVAYEPFSSTAVGFTVAAVLSLFAIMEFSTQSPIPDRTALWSVLINGVLVNAVSSVCWYRALQAASIRSVVPWVALTPLLAALFGGGAIELQPQHWIGIALVLASSLLATISSTGSANEPLSRAPGNFELAEEST
jgi:drug/metabolite transporter (DMT)-like permease